MNKITVKKGNEQYDIIIDDYKIFLGSNFNIKFDIIRTFIKCFNYVKLSEFSEECNIPKILFNDVILKNKDVMYYHVSPYFSLNDNFKLTTKSLVAKYLETILNDNEFFDTINTINILFESLESEIANSSIIKTKFNTLVSKQLLKLLTPYFIDNGYSKDEYDMTLEEIILFQLKLLEAISIKNNEVNFILITIEIPYITEQIFQQIKHMKNCYIMIFTNEAIANIDLKKYCLCQNIFLDIADENQFYQIICDNNYKLLCIEEGREYMKKYILKTGTREELDFIEKLL